MTNNNESLKPLKRPLRLKLSNGEYLVGKGLDYFLAYALENVPSHILSRALLVEKGADPKSWDSPELTAGDNLRKKLAENKIKIVESHKNKARTHGKS